MAKLTEQLFLFPFWVSMFDEFAGDICLSLKGESIISLTADL